MGRGIDEGRLGTETRVVLLLAEVIQIIVAPVGRDTRLEPVLVVKGDNIGRVANPVTAKPEVVMSS